MPGAVTVNVAITFSVDSSADAEAKIAELNAPEGAVVSASVVEQLAQGVVQGDGTIQDPAAAVPDPLPEPEAPPA